MSAVSPIHGFIQVKGVARRYDRFDHVVNKVLHLRLGGRGEKACDERDGNGRELNRQIIGFRGIGNFGLSAKRTLPKTPSWNGAALIRTCFTLRNLQIARIGKKHCRGL